MCLNHLIRTDVLNIRLFREILLFRAGCNNGVLRGRCLLHYIVIVLNTCLPRDHRSKPALEETEQEQRIIHAAIECIEREGIQGVTVRQIAEEADVNVAAINYYFRSKDRLLDRAMEQTLRNAFDDWIALFDDESLDLRAQLTAILEEIMVGIRMYPGLSRAHLYEPLMEAKRDTRFAVRFRNFLALVADEVSSTYPTVSPGLIRRALVQLFAAAMFPPFVPGFFDGLLPELESDAEERRAYIELMLNAFFHLLDAVDEAPPS